MITCVVYSLVHCSKNKRELDFCFQWMATIANVVNEGQRLESTEVSSQPTTVCHYNGLNLIP